MDLHLKISSCLSLRSSGQVRLGTVQRLLQQQMGSKTFGKLSMNEPLRPRGNKKDKEPKGILFWEVGQIIARRSAGPAQIEHTFMNASSEFDWAKPIEEAWNAFGSLFKKY